MKRFSLFFAIALLIVSSASAIGQIRERQTTEGTEFIFSFTPNLNVPDLKLFVSSSADAVALVEIPGFGFEVSVAVAANVTSVVDLPGEIAQFSGKVTDVSVRVTSDAPISIYGLNQRPATTDALMAFPTNALGKEYIVGSYGGSSLGPSQFAITAVQDNTSIEVTATDTVSGHSTNSLKSIVLDRMETILIKSGNSKNDDLTGSRIKASAPVAVTSGVVCSYVPKTIRFCDHMAEMIPPVSALGSAFLVYPLATRLNGDVLRVVAPNSATDVLVNGIKKGTLSSGKFLEFDVTEGIILNTSQPVMVMQYSKGTEADGVLSDPFMMLIPPTEQLLNKYVFSTVSIGFDIHYINVVAKAADIENIRLDGELIDQGLFVELGDSGYAGAQVAITDGSHVIASGSPFGLYVYGFADHDSYGYPGGMATEIINPINGDYKNVKVVSTLNNQDIELDVNSFVVPPSRIEALDGVTEIEWNFPEFSIGQVKNLDYDVVATNLAPGETRTITHKLELTYNDINGVEHQRTLAEHTLNVLSSGYALQLGVNKTLFNADETATVNLTAVNAGQASGVVSVQTSVVDLDGNVVAQIASVPDFLLTGESDITFTPNQFSLTGLYAGRYRVKAQLADDTGAVQAVAYQEFQIASADSAILVASASVDQPSYTVKDTVNTEVKLSNTSANALVGGATVQMQLVSASGDVVWSQSRIVNQVLPNTTEALNAAIALSGVAPGAYTLTVRVADADGNIVAATDVGFGLEQNVLFALQGDVAVSAADFTLGETPVCTFTLTNTGNETITGHATRVKAVNLSAGEDIAATDHVATLAAANDAQWSLALPALNQAGDYACVLEVAGQSASAMTVMASKVFNVAEALNTVSLEGALALGDKARLLVLTDAAANARAALAAWLETSGWYASVVTDEVAFADALAMGGFGAYALLSNDITLSEATVILLQSRVAEGDGLLVAGVNGSNAALEGMLGIELLAHEQYSDGVQGLAADWLQAQSLSFSDGLGEAQRVFSARLNGATAEGYFTKSSSLPAGVQPMPLGAPSRFNAFAIDDYTSLASSIDGTLAVGGNLSLDSFGVGDKLDPATLHTVVTVGGDVTFPQGRIFNGSLLAAGSITDVSQTVIDGLAAGAGVLGEQPLGIQFDAEARFLQGVSKALDALPNNGVVQSQWGGITLAGDCSSERQVFDVDGAMLGASHTLAQSCIPESATVVINVLGDAVHIQNIGMQGLENLRTKVIFNFPAATELRLTSVGVQGSVLAPHAQVVQPAGSIHGQVWVRSWYSTTYGYMSTHLQPFTGDIADIVSSVQQMAATRFQYELGHSVFLGFDVVASMLAGGWQESNPALALFGQLLNDINPTLIARPGKAIAINAALANTGEATTEGLWQLSAPGAHWLAYEGWQILPATEQRVLPFSLLAGQVAADTLWLQLPAEGATEVVNEAFTGAADAQVLQAQTRLPLAQ